MDPLENPNREIREGAWRDSLAHVHQFSRKDFEEVFEKLLLDVNGDIRLEMLTRLVVAQPWRPEPSDKEWFFHPFRRRIAPGSLRRSAVVSVCDREHIRDVQATLILGRALSNAQFPETHFHQVPLHNPGWAQVELNRLGAICFIGRPSMFRNCPLLSQIAGSKRLRRHLPVDNPSWRSMAVTKESADAFHHVRQERSGAEPLPHRSEDTPQRRRDFAIVQRLSVRYGALTVIVVILAGATSLGTIGAAEWVTSEDFAVAIARARSEVLRRDLADDTELEALLEVTASMPDQAGPWQVETIEPLKLFLGDSMNALHPPEVMSVRVENGRAGAVFVDGDDLRIPSTSYAQLLAICDQLAVSGSPVDLSSVQTHPAFGTSAEPPTPDQIQTAVRDNLKKYRFRDALTVESGRVVFNCKVEFI